MKRSCCTCAFCISRANSCSYVLLNCTDTDAALMIFPSARFASLSYKLQLESEAAMSSSCPTADYVPFVRMSPFSRMSPSSSSSTFSAFFCLTFFFFLTSHGFPPSQCKAISSQRLFALIWTVHTAGCLTYL